MIIYEQVGDSNVEATYFFKILSNHFQASSDQDSIDFSLYTMQQFGMGHFTRGLYKSALFSNR